MSLGEHSANGLLNGDLNISGGWGLFTMQIVCVCLVLYLNCENSI